MVSVMVQKQRWVKLEGPQMNQGTGTQSSRVVVFFMAMHVQQKQSKMSFVKPWSLSTHFFSILCNEMERYTQKSGGCGENKYWCWLFKWWADLAASFMAHHTYLKEWLPNYGYADLSIW